MCAWYRPLLFPVQGIYRDGYCVKKKSYTKSNDKVAEECEDFILVGTQEVRRK
jgi:hypothetical protein